MPTTELPHPSRDEAGRAGWLFLVGLAILAVVAGLAVMLQEGVGPLLPGHDRCRAEVGGVGGVGLPPPHDQAENASLIAATAVRRGMPARAASIALATAYQESKLYNLDHGDRDSQGLFQQRPSQGWGTEEQIQDEHYSINKFFEALEKIDGYQTMRITEAAQEVQRSGFPEAYQDHAEDGRALASALTGYSPHAFSCVVDPADDLAEQSAGESGLTPRAVRVRKDLEAAFGPQSLGGFEPGGVRSGHMSGSAHYDGRAIDIFFRPINETNKRLGWAMASYLVANADRLDIGHVIFDKRIWTAGERSEDGWRDYDPGDDPGDRAVLEHRDHVHVDVLPGS
jgi:hypothetical protein